MFNDAELPTVVVPLDHEYDEPPEAVTLIVVVEQVKTVEPVLLVIVAEGNAFTVAVTAVLVELTQPVLVFLDSA